MVVVFVLHIARQRQGDFWLMEEENCSERLLGVGRVMVRGYRCIIIGPLRLGIGLCEDARRV